MGIRKCIVPECPSSSARLEDRGVTYHKIPYLEDMKRLWIAACHLPDDYFATKASNVCSRHFRRADFQEFKGKKYVLKFGVVPTIFDWTIAKPSADDAIKGTPKASKAKDDIAKGQKAEKFKEEVPHETGDKDENLVLKEDTKVTVLMKNEQAAKVASTPAKKKSTPLSSSKRSSSSKKSSTTPAKQARVEPVVSSPKKQTPKKGSAESKQAIANETQLEEPEPGGSTPEKAIDFTPGTKIEAQDFSGTWHAAKLLEVDTEDREVLVQFDKTDKIKSTTLEEWISMDSVRLRPISNTNFSIGEKVFARWSDSRKFKATIKSIVENNMYEVVFDDGFAKICKSTHISRIKRSEEAKVEPVEKEAVGDGGGSGGIVPDTTIKTEPIGPGESADAGVSALLSLNQLRIAQVVKLSELPEIPQTGEWCCHWMNDYPVGEPSEVDLPGGRVYTVIVPDWRMPEGWIKHIFQRITTYGKMDVLLVSPTGKVLRSRQEVKTYLEEIGEEYDSNKYDFGLHMKRSKQLGCINYTQEYKDSFFPKPSQEPLLLNTEVNIGSVKVKIIDNLFQCPEADCLKTFRKENHLQIHIKHYHKELAKGLGDIPNMQDLAALRTPIELLESPKTVSRKSHAPSTSKATAPPPVVVKVEKMDEDEMAPPPEPVVESTLVPESKLGKEDGLKSPKDMKQEIDNKQSTDKPEMKIPLDTESSVAQETAGEVGAISTSSSTAGKSKPPSKVTKIKLFTQKKTSGDVKKIQQGFVTKKKSSKSKKSKRSRPSRRSRPPVASNRSAPVVRATDTSMGSYSFGNYSGAFHNELSGGFYDESINASVGGSTTGLVDENGELIKIVRMRKEEIINCLCKVTEEDGLMVQCEMCLCWQHAICQNIRNSSEVPDTYVCSICRYPYMGRSSKRYAHDQDWLYEGKLPVAKYHAANSKHVQRFDILKNSHTLTGNLLELKRFMHSLQMKINIAEKKDHPKMYLWSKKWEKSPPRGDGNSSMGTAPDKHQQQQQQQQQQQHGEGGDQQQMPQIPVPEAPIDPAECQAILLDHIQKQQNDAMGRLQAIEAQIIGLEAYDEKADLLESPTAKNYPKTKQTIHMLLNDLLKMKKIAEIHSDLHSLTLQ